MTTKEKIQRMIERLKDEEVTYDRVIYHLEFMKEIEKRLEEAESGETIPHDEVFAELLPDDAKDKDRMDDRSKGRPASGKSAHRAGRAAGSKGSRPTATKRGRKTKKPA